MAERLDPEMLKNLDLLLNMDVAENEKEWDLVEDLETVEHDPPADEDGSKQEKDDE